MAKSIQTIIGYGFSVLLSGERNPRAELARFDATDCGFSPTQAAAAAAAASTVLSKRKLIAYLHVVIAAASAT